MLAAALSLYIIANIGLIYQAKSSSKLEQLWIHDIENLSSAKKLPPFWNEISVVEKISANHDSLAELWLKTVSLPINIKPTGKYKLEILFLSQKNESGITQAIIQHHITHIPSKNSVWELARTYNLE